MNVIVSIMRTFAVALVLVLTATGLWAAGAEEEAPAAAAADKKYVTDPTTGKPVVAPEYGGTIIYTAPALGLNSDPYFGHSDGVIAGVTEKLGIGNWGVDRDEWDFRAGEIQVPYTIGRLADSWEISPDGLTYTFHIRKGVHWHDKPPMNGRELTAKDIEYNFHRMLGFGEFTEAGACTFGQCVDLLLSIPWESVTATDDWTVVMKLKEPFLAALRYMLVDYFVYIMPPEVIEQHGDTQDWRNLVGTGPFMLTDLVEESSMTYVKNPDYWGYDEKYPQNRLPYVDEFRVLIIPEEASIVAALRSGKVDFKQHVKSLDQVESLNQTNPEIVAHEWWFRSSDSFAPNHRVPPFNDINVRRAMQMALDNESIAATYWKGHANAIPHGLIRVNGYYIPFEEWDEEVKQYYRSDPEAAEKLLDEAGYPRGADGTRFKTTLNYGAWATLDYAEIAAAYWAEIGVDVEIDALSSAEYHERLWSRTGEGIYSAIAGNLFDPVMMAGWYHSDDMWNRGGSQWPELDAIVEAALAAPTDEEQKRLIAEADKYAMSQHWLIFGPISPFFTFVQPWIIGYSGEMAPPTPNEFYVIFARLWVDSELKEAMGY